jgi:hypothetical protein
MRPAILVALLAYTFAGPTTAEVYSYIDEHGNRTFTDRPSSTSAKPVEIKPGNVMSTTTLPSPIISLPTPSAQVKRAYYSSLRIDSPAREATVRGAGDVTVSVSAVPVLLSGQSYQILLDGAVVAGPAETSSFALTNIDRGTHQLSAQIVDRDGAVLIESDVQSLYVHRMSLNQKRMVNPCIRTDYGVRPECPIADKPPEPRRRFLGLF